MDPLMLELTRLFFYGGLGAFIGWAVTRRMWRDRIYDAFQAMLMALSVIPEDAVNSSTVSESLVNIRKELLG